MSRFDYNMRVETDHDTGKVLAVYLRVRKGRVVEVREYDHGNVFVNYDSRGRLLGVEVLGPCRITLLADQIARKEPDEVREFFRGTVPPQMVAA